MTGSSVAKQITKNINIIGAGASGFYSCFKLLQLSKLDKTKNISFNINLWDKLPIPFGLVRNGVAPDHPEIKNCIKTFSEIFDKNEFPNHNVKFIGNFNFTKKREYEEILSKSDLVILATGCHESKDYFLENKLMNKNTLHAKQIVDWYNSYPTHASTSSEGLKPYMNEDFWKKIQYVNIVGNGNVAFDLCRIFAMCRNAKDTITKTDINNEFVSIINGSGIKKINIIGRRDFKHAKFGTREFRELWDLDQYNVKGHIDSKYLPNPDDKVSRAVKKKSLIAQKSMDNQKTITNSNVEWELKFLQSPFKIDQEERKLLATENVIDDATLKITKTKTVLEYNNDLVILSIGTAASDLDLVTNLLEEYPDKIKTVGWLRNQGSGSIAETMIDTFALMEKQYKKLQEVNNNNSNEVASFEFLKHGASDVLTNWDDYLKVKKYEETTKGGKKCETVDEIIKVIKS